MQFLSRRRRHPLAGLLVLMFGLLVVGGLYSAFAPRAASASTAQSTLTNQGRQLFLVGCASCHGRNAQGIVTQTDSDYGPSLRGVGAAAVDFQVGTGRMPLAESGDQAERKPPQYNATETSALAAYVASLEAGPAIPSTKYTDVEGVSNSDIVRGGEFFRTNCTACHNSVGAGGALPSGLYAPTLVGVSAKYMYEAMLTGPQQMPKFSDQVITPDDKRDIIAYVKSVQSESQYGGSGLKGIGPVAEGGAVWVVGMGALVAFAVWIGAHGVRARKR